MSQSINNEEFNLKSVEQFIQERESKKDENFSFKKENDPSDYDNVFDDVLGKTLREKTNDPSDNKFHLTESNNIIYDNSFKAKEIKTEDFNYTK